MKITSGHRVHHFDFLLTRDHQVWAHEGGALYVFSPERNRHVGIDPIGMTEQELWRAVSAADTLLRDVEPAPVNRKQRRVEAATRH